jgi:hypothetical protein
LLVVASLTSLALFLAYFSIGIQRVVFSPHASAQAGRLEITKRNYRLQGAVEVVAGVLLVVGLKGTGASTLAIVNDAAAVVLLAITAWTARRVARNEESTRAFVPWAALAFACLLELVFRLFA